MSMYVSILCLLPGMGLPVPARAAGVPQDQALATSRLCELVSEDAAKALVRDLVACGPRMGGTPSGARAAALVAKHMREAGLRTEVQRDPELWCHWEDSWSLQVLEGDDVPGRTLESAWPYGFSPAAEGKVVLSTEPLAGACWLSSKQTRPRRGQPSPALVLIDGTNTLDGAYPRVRSLRANDANPFPVLGISASEGAWLRRALAQGTSLSIEFSLSSKIQRASPESVIAALPAAEGAPAGHVLFCAHGDSDAGGPGANDNASGVAVVLSIAGAWKRAVDEGLLPPPPREVRFAVWGSEIHSTRHYLQREGQQTLAVVNFDQAGFGSGAEQLNIEPDDLPANVALVRLAQKLLSERAGSDGFPAHWATNRSLGGTDSYVFSGSKLFRSEGRPAVTLFTSAWDSPDEHPKTPGMPGESWSDRDLVRVDYDNYYHSAGDTPENTTDKEPHNIAWCARVGFLLALEWLGSLDPPR